MEIITVEEAINLKKALFIDVRSPSEYQESTIPGAKNLPLFSDEERKKIGTLYHIDKYQAYEKGLKIGSSKLYLIFKTLTSFLDSVNKNTKVIIFCWRGGMRSKSITLNLQMMGIPAFQLKGGYKAYRRFVLDQLETFKNFFHFYTIHGNTGVGKTKILKYLKEKGEPVLDLEGLANNRGSIFGDIGLGMQRNQKMFDSLLYDELRKNNKDYFFVESESRRIGKILLPKFLVSAMENGTHILIRSNIKKRIEHLKQEYLPIENKNKIINLIYHNSFFEGKKGKQWVNNLITLLLEDKYDKFIETLLIDYYDPLYSHSEKKYEPYDFILYNNDIDYCVKELISMIDN
ncbi:tRNA 2-selenouridine(34) synthase MnmH [Garciella nitratireducens]|uniref:tRNA 2-selenouridine synthase n=1 Tax=Garciella nitratireducens DSM 15102 TaxID=1121911 RepID=A0A1T4JVY5_9FIRM|nr:tRNA 2-selenouridine(34) synthase MnmH [Garciella nitratireducens]SJZ34370.1 tRNA 2-selenouridine synthase [Garciella nitratireducens DSM 15102]